jgi:hypothetical protein
MALGDAFFDARSDAFSDLSFTFSEEPTAGDLACARAFARALPRPLMGLPAVKRTLPPWMKKSGVALPSDLTPGQKIRHGSWGGHALPWLALAYALPECPVAPFLAIGCDARDPALLRFCARMRPRLDALRPLRAAGLAVDSLSDEGLGVLGRALNPLGKESLDVVLWLLGEGFDPRQRETQSDPLHSVFSSAPAAPGGAPLLALCRDATTKNMALAAQIARLLGRYGADPNAIDAAGMGALHFAFHSALPLLAEALADLGADFALADRFGRAPASLIPPDPVGFEPLFGAPQAESDLLVASGEASAASLLSRLRALGARAEARAIAGALPQADAPGAAKPFRRI